MNKKPFIQQAWLRALLFIVIAFPMAIAIGFGIDIVLNGLYAYDYATGSIPIAQFLKQYATGNIGFIIIILVFVYWIDKRTLLSLGFVWKGFQTDAITGLAVSMAILFIGSSILVITQNLYITNAIFSLQQFLIAIALYILVAFNEEIIFRGYLLSNLLKSMNRWWALIIVSVLFALLHSQNQHINTISFINIFLGGILLGINYVYTKNLWFSIFFHFGWNFFQGSVLGYNISGTGIEQGSSLMHQTTLGSAYLTGGNFGFEGSILCTVLIPLMIIVLFVHYNRKEKKLRNGIV